MTHRLRLSQFILGWRRQSINLQSSFTTPRPSKHCCNFRIQTQYHQRFLSSSSSTSSIDNELAQLRSEISSLTYLIKQSSIQQDETQALARRAEARAAIIEHKLIDIQQHVIKIPALEGLVIKIRSYLKDRSPSYVRNAINRVENSGAYTLLTSKYTAWLVLGSVVIFWQYRKQMYERTSEEMANVAALTLKQDALRQTIQETLTTVANSPETLASLSILFQQLISESRTEAQLIYLIVRALNSEGVREAAIKLLDASFKNDGLQLAAGELLKVATNATVLDEQVQHNAGVGIHRAMKNAVVPQFWWMNKNNSSNNIPHNDTDTRTTDNSHAEPECVRSNDDVDDVGVGQRLENNNKTQEEAMTKQND